MIKEPHNQFYVDFLVEGINLLVDLEAQLVTSSEIGLAFEEDAGQQRERVAKLEAALMSVREDICTGPIDDTLWRGKDRMSAETTVDFICNTLSDDWDYDEWLEAAHKDLT
jgi:hypothetical protein